MEIDQQKIEIVALRQQCASLETSGIVRPVSNEAFSSTNTDTSVLVVSLQNRLKESLSLYKGVKGELDRQKKVRIFKYKMLEKVCEFSLCVILCNSGIC